MGNPGKKYSLLILERSLKVTEMRKVEAQPPPHDNENGKFWSTKYINMVSGS